MSYGKLAQKGQFVALLGGGNNALYRNYKDAIDIN